MFGGASVRRSAASKLHRPGHGLLQQSFLAAHWDMGLAGVLQVLRAMDAQQLLHLPLLISLPPHEPEKAGLFVQTRAVLAGVVCPVPPRFPALSPENPDK